VHGAAAFGRGILILTRRSGNRLGDAVVKRVATQLAILSALLLVSRIGLGSDRDAAVVAALDDQYQAAVKANDYTTMEKILADDYVLVLGTGRTYTKADLIGQAKRATEQWEHQEEVDGSQTVHLWGNTAVVTAKLWVKGLFEGKPIDVKVWFSDTYARTRSGWRYVHGQASLPLPTAQE
jgi:ketosteroid isomerase-like protein